MLNPLEQFLVKPVVSFDVFSHNIQITNSTITFLATYLIILLLTRIACHKVSLVPSKIQACGEVIFQLINGMLISTAGKNSQKFFTLIFSLFMFILISNSVGMIPSVFTTTSHISVTFTLAIFVFTTITAIGFVKNGTGYFSILLPKGTPMFLAPLIIFIELFAYLARPISLSIRLAANMTAGHVVLKVLATFVILSGLFGIMPLILLTILTGFEIFISILQAYIFSVLTCAYLSDALNLH
jgi:F-type H+-transporting ATPase subunit a